MTPKEKAKKLYNQFFDYADSNYGASKFNKNWYGNVLAGERKVRKQSAKQCSLIAVDEILNAIDWNYYEGRMELQQNYWQLVREEIDKL
jgi:hypothetical protein